MDPTEKGFRQDLADAVRGGNANGWALTARIYADWLEEQGCYGRAARLRRAVAQKRAPGLRWPWPQHLDGLSNHQRQQLAVALSGPLGILTGTPGTGKTHCAVRLIYHLRNHRSFAGSVCTPTGKAAVRLNDLLGLPLARTIHQLLGVSRSGHDGEGWGFIHNAANPLSIDWLVVDEASMLDTDLAAALLSALQPGTHVLLVGDVHQLPPVGHGAPLRDLIAAGVPCGRLSEIRRNAGRIVEACAAIQAGRPWGPGGNLEHHECTTAAQQLACLKHQLDGLQTRGYNPIQDVQVLAAVNTRGELSREVINRRVQDQLNPNGAKDILGAGIWRQGDKIVCLRNHLAHTAESNAGPAHLHHVANGDIGDIQDFHSNHATVRLTTPQRLVRIPLPSRSERKDNDDAVTWDLAYCLTAHKAQGSEWPVVVLMIDPSPAARRICTREWVYTALSRGKDRVITIGELGVLKQMCARQQTERRKTFLAEMLAHGQ